MAVFLARRHRRVNSHDCRKINKTPTAKKPSRWESPPMPLSGSASSFMHPGVRDGPGGWFVAGPRLSASRRRANALRWSALQGRDFTLLLVLLAFVFGGGVYTVWYWYDVGMASEHASDVRFAELTRIAHEDPAFQNIEFSIADYKDVRDHR